MPIYSTICKCGYKVEDTSFIRMAKRVWEHTGPTGICEKVRARDIIEMLAEKSKEGPL